MSRTAAAFSLLVVSICVGSAQSRPTPQVSKIETCATAKTQLEMNECSHAEDQRAEEEMNRLYRQLLTRASSNPVYRQKVEAAQKAWLAYRDAELEAKYPAQDKRAEYGSVYPMCFANDRTDMTQQRIQEIKALLRQSEDVCAGEWPRHGASKE
jgi:uncharacterized protein YecT (DUF1311 family)